MVCLYKLHFQQFTLSVIKQVKFKAKTGKEMRISREDSSKTLFLQLCSNDTYLKLFYPFTFS